LTGGILSRQMADEEHGPPQWECGLSPTGFIRPICCGYLERW